MLTAKTSHDLATCSGVFPPPFWRRVREGGDCEVAHTVRTPNPSPQAGAAPTEREET